MTSPTSEPDARGAFVAHIDRLAAGVVAADDPHDAAREIWDAGMGAISDVGDWAHATWLIWGSLTDGVDGPRADDAMQLLARDGIRRAAAEWLDLDKRDAKAVDAYLDRWGLRRVRLRPSDIVSGPRLSGIRVDLGG